MSVSSGPQQDMITGPFGNVPAAKAREVMLQVGFEPPAEMPLQDAFMLFLQIMQRRMSQEQQIKTRKPRGRTAVKCSIKDVPRILTDFDVSLKPMAPIGAEVLGVDLCKPLDPVLAGALEMQMAHSGFLLFKGQGSPQNEMGVEGRYLLGEQQCEVTESFGPGALHSTHGVHEKCPNRDIFRLSNDTSQGFNEVGPEWHNDGSFERQVFSHVVYHIIKAPEGPGNTAFAHLGVAYDKLRPEQKQRFKKCASINSNSGCVHPLVHDHPVSGRPSLYLHTGMTGAVIERKEEPKDDASKSLAGIHAWSEEEMNPLFCEITELLDSPDVSYSHKWCEGDVIIIDNIAVAHKALPGAHTKKSGLRILHRTTGKGMQNLDPDPSLNFPLQFDTRSCPFPDSPVWVDGYVGYRWGNWQDRSVPH